MAVSWNARALERALRDALAQLDQQLPRALTMVGGLVRDHARRTTLFRDRTGTLRRSIGAPVVTGSFSGGNLAMHLAAGLGNVAYARFVHDGTRAHRITTKPPGRPARIGSGAGSLRFVRGGNTGFVFRNAVQHPGTAPRPFMTEAIATATPEAERIIVAATKLAFVRAGFED